MFRQMPTASARSLLLEARHSLKDGQMDQAGWNEADGRGRYRSARPAAEAAQPILPQTA